MKNYFRLTAYEPNKNITMILDCYGLFEKKWQFSSFCIKRGCKIINITDDEQMIDVNCGKMTENPNQFRLMAYIEGTAEHIKYDLNGNTYNAIKVGDKIYIPEK